MLCYSGYCTNCGKVVSKLARHIKERHSVKHSYFECTRCHWAALRRADVTRHLRLCSGQVATVSIPSGILFLHKCRFCHYSALDLTGHQCVSGSSNECVVSEARGDDNDCVVNEPLDLDKLPKLTIQFDVEDCADGGVNLVMTGDSAYTEKEFDSELSCGIPELDLDFLQ